MHRGKQYVRAIQLYYRKFNAYPPNLDALVKTNEIRFLRKKYIDPTTGKADWKPIMMCQNKTPMAMDFFGQPLGAASGCGVVGGMVPGGGAGLPGSPLQGGVGGNGTSGSIFNNSPTANGSIFSNPPAGSSPDGGTSGTGIRRPVRLWRLRRHGRQRQSHQRPNIRWRGRHRRIAGKH